MNELIKIHGLDESHYEKWDFTKTDWDLRLSPGYQRNQQLDREISQAWWQSDDESDERLSHCRQMLPPPPTHTHIRRLLWGALLGVGNPWLSFSRSVPRHSWSCTSTRGATPGSCVDAHDKPVPANTRPWPIAGSRLGQRRRRWTSLEPAMGQRIVYAIIVMSPTQTQYTSKVGPLPQTLVKNRNNVSMQLSKEHPYQVIPGVLALYWANVVIKMGHTGSACTVINLSLIGHSFPTYYRTMHWCTSSLGTDQHLRNITSQPIFTVNHIIKSYKIIGIIKHFQREVFF